MAKRTPGLRKKGNVWHIEKTIFGELVRCSTRETELDQAERFLANLIEQKRKTKIYGERLERTFNEASARYIEEYAHKKSLDRDIVSLKIVMPFIGHIELKKIHSGILDGFINSRKLSGISAGTINRDIAVIRRVLSLSARMWRDDNGNPWLDTPPLLPIVQGEKRKPRPINWKEQDRLMQQLPDYLADMVLFALNTGLRDQEICGLRWDDECKLSGTENTVFIVTEDRSKNGHERIVPLNSVARSIVQGKRNNGSEYVFNYKSRRLDRINNKAWRKSRELAGLADVRVHDLRHTFGMRLRSAGVSFEDRQDLLGHHAGRMTTHYSKAEITNLIDCVELLCEARKPELTLVRRIG